MAGETIDSVFKDFNTPGNPLSGDYEPEKPRIRALLRRIQNASGLAITKNTLAALNGVTPPTENYMGIVLDDPDPSNNGYYSRVSNAWVWERGFRQTFAEFINLGGTANAQTGDLENGVDLSEVRIFIVEVETENTGPMTFNGIDVVNAAGNPLSAGEWTSTVLFRPNSDGDYQLLIDAGAAAAAAQSASDAQTALADFNEKYLGAFADDTSATTAAGGSPVTGALYWNTTTGQLKTWDGAAWQVSSASIPDGAISDAKVATPATPADGIASSKIAYLLSATDAASRSLADKLGDSISVKDFGATGDGVRLWADVSITSGAAALEVTGAQFTADDVGKLIIVSGAGASGSDLVTTIAAFTDAENVTLTDDAGTTITAMETLVRYGTDDTDALTAAFAHTIANLPTILVIPKGNYFHTGLGNLNHDGLNVFGASMLGSILTYCGVGGAGTAALLIDAFPGTEVNPFVQDNNWSNLTIEAHATVSNIVSLQGLARSRWENINLREGCLGQTGTGANYAMFWRGVMLCRFIGVQCSTNLQPMAAECFGGIYVDEGRRNGTSIGHSSNDQLIHCYWEGLNTGVSLQRCDQLLMLGGAPEACSQYGQVVSANCRYNTFIGVAYENLGATRDVSDSGIYSRYINCYASEHFLLSGRGTEVSGSYFERFEVSLGAKAITVNDITVNHWNTGSGGFFDSTDGEVRFRNIYDSDLGTFIYPYKARSSLTVGSTPFERTNTSNVPEKILIIGGTVTQVLLTRGGADNWIEGNPVASGGSSTRGVYILQPSEKITVTFSSAPTINRMPMQSL